MTEPAFRGTLLSLQNCTRRDPEAYRDEFISQLDHFKALSKTIMSQKALNPQYIAVLNYVCHVGHCYPVECAEVAEVVLKLLQEYKGTAMSPELRLVLVKSLALMRSKNIVTAERAFPLLFQLLQEREKNLRRVILSHIVSDVRKVNMPKAKNGAQVNKMAQNFLFSVMADDDPVQARCAEMVMIDLYRRRIWANERTVEVLTQACFSKHTPILRTALRFFLLQMPKITSLDDDDDTDNYAEDPGREISRMKQKMKIVKKTSKRERILKREMSSVKRKYNKEEKAEELLAKQHVDPIRLLRNPHQFVERLLTRLQKTTERFEVRILYLNVIARVISEYDVVHLPLYGFLERYMEPSQLHVTQLLALSVMCVHRLVPPDALEPLMKAIANHFVSDRSSADSITIGLNTIREICKRQPLAMNADLLKDLTEYKSQRGDRGVMMAARALIQLYRDVYPELLPSKLRGNRGAAAAEENQRPVYGKERVFTDVPGLELLYAADGNEEEENDHSSCCSSDDDDDDTDGTWMTDSSDCDPDDIEGSFVDASDASDTEDEDCPQLVPVGLTEGEPSVKRYRRDDDGDAISDVLSVSTADNAEKARASSSMSFTVQVDAEPHEMPRDNKPCADMEEEEDMEEEDDEEEDDEEECEDEEKWEEGDEEDADNEESEWFEDTDMNSTRPSQRSAPSPAKAPSVATNKVPAAAMRILSDADFERIRRLEAQNGSHRTLRGKVREHDARSKKRHELIHGVSADLSSHDIEHFTEKKRMEDREEKIAKAQEARRATSKFEARKKKKSKLNSTHSEHAKRGKLFNMTKRSRRVGAKLKASAGDRSNLSKENKKKDIKFRIRRGWKA